MLTTSRKSSILRSGSPFAMLAMVAIISLSFLYHVSVQFDLVLERRPCGFKRQNSQTTQKIHFQRNTNEFNATSQIAKIRIERLQQALFELKIMELDANTDIGTNDSEYDLHQMTFNNIKGQDHPACQYYINKGKKQQVALTKIWKDTGTYDPLDVTLVTQITASKLGTVSNLLNHWPGPVSCSIYISNDDITDFPNFIKRFSIILNKDNLDIHLVYGGELLYPINFLRNIALNNTYTQYVFLSDVDFMPSFGLYDYLQDFLQKRSHLKNEVLVVPALEFTSPAGIKFPKDKGELMYLWNKRIITPTESLTHATTDYSLWRTTKMPYRVKYSENYEPYIVANRHIIPPYNTSFLYGFRDKISHLLQIHAMGLKFTVVPEHFTIHIPHRREKRLPFYQCSQFVYQDFQNELSRKYPRMRGFFKNKRNEASKTEKGTQKKATKTVNQNAKTKNTDQQLIPRDLLSALTCKKEGKMLVCRSTPKEPSIKTKFNGIQQNSHN